MSCTADRMYLRCSRSLELRRSRLCRRFTSSARRTWSFVTPWTNHGVTIVDDPTFLPLADLSGLAVRAESPEVALPKRSLLLRADWLDCSGSLAVLMLVSVTGTMSVVAQRVGVRSKRGSFAGKFLTKGYAWITDALRPLDIVARFHEEDGYVCASIHKSDDSPLLEEDAARLESRIESDLAALAEKDVLEWNSMVEEFVGCLKNVLNSYHVASHVPEDGEWEEGLSKCFDKERIKSITAAPIEPSGAAGMEQFEYTFSAGGTQLLYPQPLKFTEGHWKLWSEQSPYPRRRVLEQVYAMVTWIPHEVLHCVQDLALGAVGAGGRSPLSYWQCEYSVCFGQTLFLETLIAEQRKQGSARRRLPLPSHIAEESLLWLEAATRTCSPPESQEWSVRWSETQGAKVPLPGDEAVDPTSWMVDHHREYLALLGGVVLRSAERYQALVEKEEQTTSYWAECAKYINRILKSTSDEELANVVSRLVVPSP
eukprot:Hpha_TRINITY_DN16105_c0_g2::TRINITY_DN16105_c0_g2_i1::g.7507::m.7507